MNLNLRAHLAVARLLERFKQNEPTVLRKRADRSFARGDNAAGVSALLALADSKDPVIAFRLGECFERGTGVIPNFVDAVHWYGRAAGQEHVKAMSRLGDIYLSGRVIGIGGLVIAATESEPTRLGCNRLRPNGMSVSQDFTKALHWNRLAAELGDADAQARLGGQYFAGLGVTPDFAQAETWFRASAEQGCASGQLGLGAYYATAMPGIADNGKATAMFEKAAAQGNPLAKLSLALSLIAGQDQPADPARGAKLLTEAAEANVTEAMFRLGELYRARTFAGHNFKLAEIWLRRAGTRGHTPALLALASLLIEDLTIPDYESAAIILRDAADRGDSRARHVLDQLVPAGEPISTGVEAQPN